MMAGEYIIHLITTWVSAIFVALAITAVMRYKIATVLKELWLFLAVVIATYAVAYTFIAVYYTCVLAIYGRVAAVQGGKSVPGLSTILFAALVTTTLTYIVGYIATGGESKRVLKYVFLDDPLLAIINVLGWLSFAYVFFSPSDAIYFVTDEETTVVYSESALILGGMFLMAWLHIPYLLFKETESKVAFKSVAYPLKVLALITYSELLAGYLSMLIASIFYIDTYPAMSLFFLFTSIAAVTLFYRELASPFVQYSTLIASQARPRILPRGIRERRPVGKEVELKGRVAVRFEPEEDYASVLRDIISKASEEKKVIILAPLNSPLLRYAYKEEENILRLPFVVTGVTTPISNVLPANNLPLVANTIFNAARELGEDAYIVIDGLSDLIMVNDLKRVYVTLKQLSELLPQATLVVTINWRALSERDYSAIASLFDQIYSVENGRLKQVKGALAT